MPEETFPILTWHLDRFPDVPPCPDAIPYHLVAAHERQALHNHGNQTVARLKERHGLDPIEAWFVLHDQPYCAGQITMLAAVRYLRQIAGVP